MNPFEYRYKIINTVLPIDDNHPHPKLQTLRVVKELEFRGLFTRGFQFYEDNPATRHGNKPVRDGALIRAGKLLAEPPLFLALCVQVCFYIPLLDCRFRHPELLYLSHLFPPLAFLRDCSCLVPYFG